MEMFIMGNFSMDGELDWLWKYFQIMSITMVITKMICFMVRDFTIGTQMSIFWGSLKQDQKKKVLGKEGTNMLGKLKETNVMELVLIYIQMALDMRVSGLKEKNMDLLLSLVHQDKNLSGFLRWGKSGEKAP